MCSEAVVGPPKLWPVSDRATCATEGLRLAERRLEYVPRGKETCGQRFRRGRETRAEQGRFSHFRLRPTLLFTVVLNDFIEVIDDREQRHKLIGQEI